MARYLYTIPGILTDLHSVATWDYRAQSYFAKLGFVSAGYHYAADVIGGAVWRSHLAADVAADLCMAQSAKMDIVLLGHSNGCDIILEAIKKTPQLKNMTLHLMAAAVPDGCHDNGLNLAAIRGQLKAVTLYVSPVDEVLPLALEPFYGDLGKAGPYNACPQLASVMNVVSRRYRHSDWIGDYFQETIGLIAGSLNG